MKKALFTAKRYFLSTHTGRTFNDFIHKHQYTLKKAKNASIHYYGDERFAEDMLSEAREFKFTFREYYMYHFEKTDYDTRRTFIPVRETKYSAKLNPFKESMIFYSKGDTYKLFSKYYKRDVIQISRFNDAEKNAFKEMFQIHKCLVFKPYNGAEGVGIKIMNFCDKSFETVWDFTKKNYKNGCLVEEVIKQREELSVFVSGVVNTLRVVTVVVKDRVEVLGASWRCARVGSQVDNAARGGLLCGLNEEGKVLAVGTEDGIDHITHPDTGQKIVGFQIPDFDKAIKLAKELAMVCPKVRYVGWDLALTDAGWIMIEGNSDSSYVIWQKPLHKGTTPMLDPIMKELNLNKK